MTSALMGDVNPVTSLPSKRSRDAGPDRAQTTRPGPTLSPPCNPEASRDRFEAAVAEQPNRAGGGHDEVPPGAYRPRPGSSRASRRPAGPPLAHSPSTMRRGPCLVSRRGLPVEAQAKLVVSDGSARSSVERGHRLPALVAVQPEQGLTGRIGSRSSQPATAFPRRRRRSAARRPGRRRRG